MDGSGPTDLFATKGIEYLVAIGFLLAFFVFWRFLNRTPERAAAPHSSPAPTPWFRLPGTLFYHQGHTWARPAGDGLVRVGLDDFAQRLIGKPSALALPEVGRRIEQGGSGGQLRFESKAVGFLSPVGGEVRSLNQEVLRSPGLVNDDPYGKGWLMEVRVPELKANLKNLLSGALAESWMEQTVRALRRRTAGKLGTVLQDGGLPVTGMARNLSPGRWDEIAMDFLLTRFMSGEESIQ